MIWSLCLFDLRFWFVFSRLLFGLGVRCGFGLVYVVDLNLVVHVGGGYFTCACAYLVVGLMLRCGLFDCWLCYSIDCGCVYC